MMQLLWHSKKEHDIVDVMSNVCHHNKELRDDGFKFDASHMKHMIEQEEDGTELKGACGMFIDKWGDELTSYLVNRDHNSRDQILLDFCGMNVINPSDYENYK